MVFEHVPSLDRRIMCGPIFETSKDNHYASGAEKTFLQYFIVILKRKLQNY